MSKDYRSLVLAGKLSVKDVPDNKQNAIRLECLNILGFAQRNRQSYIVPTSQSALVDHADVIAYLTNGKRTNENGKPIQPCKLAPSWLTIDQCEMAINLLSTHFGYSQETRVLGTNVEYCNNKRGGDLVDNFFHVMLTEYQHKELQPGEQREMSKRTCYWSFSHSHYALKLTNPNYPNVFPFIWQYPNMTGFWVLGCAVSPFRIKSPHFQPWYSAYDGSKYTNR